MKSCRELREKIYLYCYQELSVLEKVELEKHMAQCKDCAVQLQRTRELLEIVSKKTVPEQSLQFWSDYDLTLKEKLKTRKKSSTFTTPSSIRRGLEEMKFHLLRPFSLWPAARWAAVALLLLIGALLLMQLQFNKEREIASLPTEIVREVPPEPAESPENEEISQEAVPPVLVAQGSSVSPELEDELLLQEMLLLTELGEELDLPLSDEEMIKEMEMITEINSS